MNYKESVHMRLSKSQKEALVTLSTAHKITMSTALRWMIDYCTNDPEVLSAVVLMNEEGESEDGVV